MSQATPSTKRTRLLARVRDIEEKLERLVPDMYGSLTGETERAFELISEVRKELESGDPK